MKPIYNYYVLLLLGFFFMFFSSCKKSEQSAPNIIYILADDLGYGDVRSFNADSKINTPNLDELAAEGMIFTDAHTSSSVCTPTRYGILTGRYNWRSTLKKGVLWGYSEALIPQERETVASLLKKSGYTTAFIGKWHLGWNWGKDENDKVDFALPVEKGPNSLGFDYSYGHAASLDIPPYVYVENGQATAIPVNTTENTGKKEFWRKGLTSPDFVHEEVTQHFFDKAISYIEDKAKDKTPFFLYLPLPSPHTPILPSDNWKGKSGLNTYADFVMMIDDYVGSLLKQVKASGIEENTMIVFVSDNGCSPMANFDELLEKGHNPSSIFRGHKADIFEGGHRVPFIVKWPEMIERGSVSNKTICTTDFMATCASITNQTLNDNTAEDSFSMLPLFQDPESKAYERNAVVHHSVKGSFAIREGAWKLILCPDSGGWSYPIPGVDSVDDLPKFQLYNLEKDPKEADNLVDQYPDVVESLKNSLILNINNGRSTLGSIQRNDHVDEWPQIKWMQE